MSGLKIELFYTALCMAVFFTSGGFFLLLDWKFSFLPFLAGLLATLNLFWTFKHIEKHLDRE